MTLDMGPLLRGEVSRIDIDYRLTPQAMDDVEFVGDARVVGNVSGSNGYYRLVLEVCVDYLAACARCLSQVERTLSFPFERTVAEEKNLTEQQREESVDEYAIVQNGRLDLDEELREVLILEMPMRFLCSEDCPGLCPKCGKPKRDGSCNCSEKEIDPRWAKLAKIRDSLPKDPES